jgi:hypothetical protein
VVRTTSGASVLAGVVDEDDELPTSVARPTRCSAEKPMSTSALGDDRALLGRLDAHRAHPRTVAVALEANHRVDGDPVSVVG